MFTNYSHIDLKPQSEDFTYLPKAPDRELLYYLNSFGHQYPTRDYYVERYHNDSYMINYTVRGECRMIHNGTSYTLRPGVLAIAHLDSHNIMYPTSDDLEFYFFHVQGALTQKIYQTVTAHCGNIITDFPQALVEQLYYSLRDLQSPDNMPFFDVSKCIGSFLTDVLKRALEKTFSYSPLIHEIHKLTTCNQITVGEIAERLNFSPIYLERHFKKHVGISLREYLCNQKIERAENLLLTTDMTVYEISQHLGYVDSVGLIRLFRKYHDVSPLEFRKLHRK